MTPQTRLVEIFSSIQGEAECIGCRQLFVRFFGCNRRCRYCDSPEALQTSGAPRYCRVERTPGRGDWESLANPVPMDILHTRIAELNRAPHHSLSLTGGEPLLHTDFLTAFLPAIRAQGLPIYLETNGTLPDALQRVLPLVDLIAMDIKLPSVCGEALADHARFLELARERQAFVKIVVSADTDQAELAAAIALIAGVDRTLPLTLQPVTPTRAGIHPPTVCQLLDWQSLALRELKHVRVIPQAHKIIGAL